MWHQQCHISTQTITPRGVELLASSRAEISSNEFIPQCIPNLKDLIEKKNRLLLILVCTILSSRHYRSQGSINKLGSI